MVIEFHHLNQIGTCNIHLLSAFLLHKSMLLFFNDAILYITESIAKLANVYILDYVEILSIDWHNKSCCRTFLTVF
jgi:hypothetical protein